MNKGATKEIFYLTRVNASRVVHVLDALLYDSVACVPLLT